MESPVVCSITTSVGRGQQSGKYPHPTPVRRGAVHGHVDDHIRERVVCVRTLTCKLDSESHAECKPDQRSANLSRCVRLRLRNDPVESFIRPAMEGCWDRKIDSILLGRRKAAITTTYESMIAQVGSMARTLLGGGPQQKTKSKKRAVDVEDTLADEYTEKRVKLYFWERSENQEVEAFRATTRARCISFQRFMAASDRIIKDAEDLHEYLKSLPTPTKEDDTLLRSSLWSRFSRRIKITAINVFRILRVWDRRNQSGRKNIRRFLSSQGGSGNRMKKPIKLC